MNSRREQVRGLGRAGALAFAVLAATANQAAAQVRIFRGTVMESVPAKGNNAPTVQRGPAAVAAVKEKGPVINRGPMANNMYSVSTTELARTKGGPTISRGPAVVSNNTMAPAPVPSVIETFRPQPPTNVLVLPGVYDAVSLPRFYGGLPLGYHGAAPGYYGAYGYGEMTTGFDGGFGGGYGYPGLAAGYGFGYPQLIFGSYGAPGYGYSVNRSWGALRPGLNNFP